MPIVLDWTWQVTWAAEQLQQVKHHAFNQPTPAYPPAKDNVCVGALEGKAADARCSLPGLAAARAAGRAVATRHPNAPATAALLQLFEAAGNVWVDGREMQHTGCCAAVQTEQRAQHAHSAGSRLSVAQRALGSRQLQRRVAALLLLPLRVERAAAKDG